MKRIITVLALLLFVSAAQAQDYRRNNRDRNVFQRPKLVLNATEFAQVLLRVKNTTFKDEKPDAFRIAMGNRLVLTNQVAELLKLTPFNDEKLDWAKLAYRYTADKQHYFLLRSQLSFLSTQNEFDTFLLSQSSNAGPYAEVINKNAYADLKNAISREPFKDAKKKVFQLAMQNQLMTTNQLRDLISQFSFDDEKLDWMMLAYNYTADTGRFYLLCDSLTFASSKDKLDKFLLNQE